MIPTPTSNIPGAGSTASQTLKPPKPMPLPTQNTKTVKQPKPGRMPTQAVPTLPPVASKATPLATALGQVAGAQL